MSSRARAATTAVVLLALLSGCRRGATASASAATSTAVRPLVGRAFGDSAAFGARILTLDRRKELATISLAAPAYLTVLAVIPGREIELVMPHEGASPERVRTGRTTLNVQRFELDHRSADADATARDMLAYERCMAAQRAAVARRAPVKTARTDSAGRPVYAPPVVDAVESARLENSCDRSSGSTAAARRVSTPRMLAPREPAERYLVVLASALPLSVAQLNERLATLTTRAPDVATTIEAIAAGLFAGLPDAWSGYYVNW